MNNLKNIKYVPRTVGRNLMKLFFSEYRVKDKYILPGDKLTIKNRIVCCLSPTYKNRIKKYDHNVYSVNTDDSDKRENWWILDEQKKDPEIILMLPRVHPDSLSGGPNTALIFAYHIAKLGYKVCCISISPDICSNVDLHDKLKLLMNAEDDIMQKFYVIRLDDRPKVGYCDIPIATCWESAEYIHAVSKILKKKFIYFIQDFEAMFFPWGESHARALQTYCFNFLPIINERFLAEFYFRFGAGNFSSIEFQRSALIFEPAISPEHFYQTFCKEHKKRLVFYARPNAPRNLYHLGLSALGTLVRKGVLNSETWDVYLMGEKLPPVDLGCGMTAKPCPWLDFSGYAKFIRESDVGLSLMLSPHTSYMPLELAASGVPVVTSCYSLKTSERLQKISPLIIGVNPTLENISQGLCDAIALRDQLILDPEKVGKFSLPSSWEESFSPVMEKLKNIFI